MYTMTAKDPNNADIYINFPGPEFLTIITSLLPNTEPYFDTLADLKEDIPDFNGGVTLICRTSQKDRLNAAGFTNVICIDDYQDGDKWTLQNGYYAQKRSYTNTSGVEWYKPDGTRATNSAGVSLSNNVNDNQVALFMPWYPEEEGKEMSEAWQALAVGSSVATRNAVELSSVAFTWQPNMYPPLYQVTSRYRLTSKEVIALSLSISALNATLPLDRYNEFFDGIDINSDPFAENPDGPATTGGGVTGGGGYDRSSDPIDHPGLPGLSAVDTGFITIYNPSLTQLKNLASYMWSGAFDINTFRKIFADPMDAILGLSIVPVTVPNGGTQTVKVGNIDTGVSMTKAATQYVKRNCGAINLGYAANNSYLDYGPYTKAYIFLPYIGAHAIDIDDIINKQVSVHYNVDILSGACTATIKCGSAVKYDFQGSCSSEIPVTGVNFSRMINGILSIGGQIGQMVATGGTVAPIAAAGIATTAINSVKPDIEKSGAIGSMGGLLGRQTPALILSTPRFASGKSQNKFLGYPSFEMVALSELSGFTVVENLRLTRTTATVEEYTEIISLLETGVIF